MHWCVRKGEMESVGDTTAKGDEEQSEEEGALQREQIKSFDANCVCQTSSFLLLFVYFAFSQCNDGNEFQTPFRPKSYFLYLPESVTLRVHNVWKILKKVSYLAILMIFVGNFQNTELMKIRLFFQFLNTVDLNLFLSKCHNPHWNVEYKRNRWYLQWIPRRQPSRNRPSDWTSCNNWCRNPTKTKSQKYCWPVKVT